MKTNVKLTHAFRDPVNCYVSLCGGHLRCWCYCTLFGPVFHGLFLLLFITGCQNQLTVSIKFVNFSLSLNACSLKFKLSVPSNIWKAVYVSELLSLMLLSFVTLVYFPYEQGKTSC